MGYKILHSNVALECSIFLYLHWMQISVSILADTCPLYIGITMLLFHLCFPAKSYIPNASSPEYLS
jgi:hypothetical protein